mgnify:CR=1 FL=1
MPMTPHDLVVEAKAQIKEVSTGESQQMLGKRVIIDVREYDEYAAGHLPGAINIPRGILEFKIGMVPECANKNGAFLIYCRTSGRAYGRSRQGGFPAKGQDDHHARAVAAGRFRRPHCPNPGRSAGEGTGGSRSGGQ